MRKLQLLICLLLCGQSLLAQGVPNQISYQGILFENDFPFTGQKTFTFTIGDWTETHENVEILDGRYLVQLGAIIPITADIFSGNSSVALKIAVDGEEFSPDVDLLTVPYAFVAQKAQNADSLGGESAMDILSKLKTKDLSGFDWSMPVSPFEGEFSIMYLDQLLSQPFKIQEGKAVYVTNLRVHSSSERLLFDDKSIAAGEANAAGTSNPSLGNPFLFKGDGIKALSASTDQVSCGLVIFESHLLDKIIPIIELVDSEIEYIVPDGKIFVLCNYYSRGDSNLFISQSDDESYISIWRGRASTRDGNFIHQPLFLTEGSKLKMALNGEGTVSGYLIPNDLGF